MKATDSGRKVYGGGGITPDEKYTPPQFNVFQRRVGPIVNTPNAFYHFASIYFGAAQPRLPAGWQPDDQVLSRFQRLP